MIRLMQGDCLELMAQIPDGSVDCVVADPPYSSGGLYLSSRQKSTTEKYCDTSFNGAARLGAFTGDNMDQLSFCVFMRMIFFGARPKLKPGGICGFFCDWRQLSAGIIGLQISGYLYRGIVVWNKGTSRNIPYRFRNDCEYFVWGTNGPRPTPMKKNIPVFPGYYNFPRVPGAKRKHQTEKSVQLLERLVQIVPQGGVVLDPFMGSGTTGVACVRTGRNFIGIELDAHYFDVAKERIAAAEREREEAQRERDCEFPFAETR